MSECEHEYVQPVTDEVTGDTVSECCHCEDILGFAEPHDQLPAHWFDHSPGDNPHLGLTGRDVLSGEIPNNPHDERFVRICGNCGNWMDAVHAGYFEGFEEDEIYASMLREALCAECGCSIFRWHQFVACLSDAKSIKGHSDWYTRYILNTADIDFWHSTAGGEMIGPSIVGQRTRYIDGEYACRCPACGYAVAYGSRKFDFHHWDYEDDVGCMLCRRCHSLVHRGMTAAEQRDNAGTEWQRDAVPILYEVATRNGLSFHDPVGFCNRFNIPTYSVAQQTASELFSDTATSVPLGDYID